MLQNLDKCYIETLELAGFKTALHAMRNPKESWHLNDSITGINFENALDGRFYSLDPQGYICVNGDYVNNFVKIGPNDMKLSTTLTKAGPEHRKFNRMIYVSADMVLPRFIYQELDTYKVGTVTNSDSTMHKLLNSKTPITLDRFVYYKEELGELNQTIAKLESMRVLFLEAVQNKNVKLQNQLLKRAKVILPEGFLLMRTMVFNYEVLRNIYHQRKTHRMNDFWGDMICKWIESLPYAKEFITDAE